MLDTLDPRGRIRESLEQAAGKTRAQLLLGALTGTVAGGAVAPTAEAAALSATDTRILRFDLQLEYLQATMYTEALRIGRLSATFKG